MLTVDLAELGREGRIEVDADLPPETFSLGEGGDIQLRGPLAVHLVVTRVGQDLIARGRVHGELVIECRRCLEPVEHPIDEEVEFIYRSGIDRLTAEEEEVYILPEGAGEVDLEDAVQEHLFLSIPRFVVCRAECRGLCPKCGIDLNEGTCTCEDDETDDRWAPLRGLKLE